MADELLAYRDRFPTLRRGPYLAAHTLGPMPDTAPDALAGSRPSGRSRGWSPGTAGWSSCGPRPCWRGCSTPPGSVALGPNVSVLAGQVLSCFDWSGRRSRLVTTDLEFPTCDYLYRAQETLGAKVEVVPSRDLAVDTGRLLEAIDTQTALVAVTHVAFAPRPCWTRPPWPPAPTRWGRWSCWTPTSRPGPSPSTSPARRRPAGRRLGQVAAGRPRHRLPVRPPRGGRRPGPVAGRLVRPRAAVRLRPSPIALAGGAGRFVTGTPNVAAHAMAAEGYRLVAEAGVGPSGPSPAARWPGCWTASRPRARSSADPPTRPGGAAAWSSTSTAPSGHRADRPRLHLRLPPGTGLRLGPHLYTTDDECDAVVAEVASIRGL